MANVAQLVRASGCGSEGRGFDPLHSPHEIILKTSSLEVFLFAMITG